MLRAGHPFAVSNTWHVKKTCRLIRFELGKDAHPRNLVNLLHGDREFLLRAVLQPPGHRAEDRVLRRVAHGKDEREFELALVCRIVALKVRKLLNRQRLQACPALLILALLAEVGHLGDLLAQIRVRSDQQHLLILGGVVDDALQRLGEARDGCDWRSRCAVVTLALGLRRAFLDELVRHPGGTLIESLQQLLHLVARLAQCFADLHPGPLS
mmetsp:Transcript_15474/g.42767  ORF Transcript_15474/g.42767 Transcript_15474/m.42767 type:complete len:212 (-) Transcript_15474:86-721(-)